MTIISKTKKYSINFGPKINTFYMLNLPKVYSHIQKYIILFVCLRCVWLLPILFCILKPIRQYYVEIIKINWPDFRLRRFPIWWYNFVLSHFYIRASFWYVEQRPLPLGKVFSRKFFALLRFLYMFQPP